MSSRWVTRLIVLNDDGLGSFVDACPRRSAGSGCENQFQRRLGFVQARHRRTMEHGVAELSAHDWRPRLDRLWCTHRTGVGHGCASVGPSTELSVLNLDDHVAQVRLTQGTMSVRVRAVDADDALEVDTPAGAVSLLQPGLYRLDVNDAGDSTVITVRQGEADLANGTTDVVVTRSQSATVTLDSSQPDVRPAIRINEFEDWCLARDRRTDNVQATRYVSAGTIGYEDLDANGSWQTVPQYGAVWVPRVRAEWALTD